MAMVLAHARCARMVFNSSSGPVSTSSPASSLARERHSRALGTDLTSSFARNQRDTCLWSVRRRVFGRNHCSSVSNVPAFMEWGNDTFTSNVSARRRLSIGFKSKHGIALNRKRGIVQVAAAQEEEKEPKNWTLEQLDEQLDTLASRETAFRASGGSADQNKSNDKNMLKVKWPAFDDGFLAYAAIFLFLITIVNNVLYRIFTGSPVANKRISPPTVTNERRHRLTSRDQTRGTREAQLALEATERGVSGQSKEAPPLTND